MKLPLAIDANPKQAFRIRLKFNPSTAVGNNLGGIELDVVLIKHHIKISARRTDKLADDNAFSSVDDKTSRIRHDRKFTDVDIFFFHHVHLTIV